MNIKRRKLDYTCPIHFFLTIFQLRKGTAWPQATQTTARIKITECMPNDWYCFVYSLHERFKEIYYTCQITMDASSFGDFLKLIICLFLSLLGVKKAYPASSGLAWRNYCSQGKKCATNGFRFSTGLIFWFPIRRASLFSAFHTSFPYN